MEAYFGTSSSAVMEVICTAGAARRGRIFKSRAVGLHVSDFSKDVALEVQNERLVKYNVYLDICLWRPFM